MDSIIEFFQKLQHLEDLIRWGGYTILALIIFGETGLLIGFFLPGDSLIVTAGLLASRGYLNIWILFALLSAMAIAGDAVGYWFGRVTGPKIFTKEKSILFARDHLIHAQRIYEKYGNRIIIMARFMPIVRTFAPIVAGVGQMPYARFASYNVIGGILWIGSMLTIGYTLGNVVPDIDKYMHWVIIVIVFVSISPGIIEYARHRLRVKRENG
jgi:membrane-associated protein